MVYWKWKPLVVRRIVIFFLDLESCEIQNFPLLLSLSPNNISLLHTFVYWNNCGKKDNKKNRSDKIVQNLHVAARQY